MSGEDFGDAIAAAISDYLAAEGGGWVNAFHVTVDFTNSDGQQEWLHASATDQTLHTTMGLIEWARGITAHQQRQSLDESGD